MKKYLTCSKVSRSNSTECILKIIFLEFLNSFREICIGGMYKRIFNNIALNIIFLDEFWIKLVLYLYARIHILLE